MPWQLCIPVTYGRLDTSKPDRNCRQVTLSAADLFGNPRPPKNVCPIAPGFGQTSRAGREALGAKAGDIELAIEVIHHNLTHRIQRAVDPACIHLV